MMPGSRSWIVSKMRLKTMGNNHAIASPQSFNGKFRSPSGKKINLTKIVLFALVVRGSSCQMIRKSKREGRRQHRGGVGLCWLVPH